MAGTSKLIGKPGVLLKFPSTAAATKEPRTTLPRTKTSIPNRKPLATNIVRAPKTHQKTTNNAASVALTLDIFGTELTDDQPHKEIQSYPALPQVGNPSVRVSGM